MPTIKNYLEYAETALSAYAVDLSSGASNVGEIGVR
jgi:hypothetical protein